MKSREFTALARTNNLGRIMIGAKEEMNDFTKQWPNRDIYLKLEVAADGKKSSPLRGYYFKKVVPDMQKAFREVEGLRLTQEQTDKRLREMSPLTIREYHNGEKWEREVLEIRQLDDQQLVFFIEHLKELAAEEYHTFIDDPQTILK